VLSRHDVPDGAWYEYRPAPPEIIARARRIAAVCEQHGVTLPEAAVHFPVRHPAVVSVAVGARDGAQSAGNLERADRDLPEDLWAELEAEGLVRPLS
jgi:D-threo-aldose 1-dehydrogenase